MFSGNPQAGEVLSDITATIALAGLGVALPDDNDKKAQDIASQFQDGILVDKNLVNGIVTSWNHKFASYMVDLMTFIPLSVQF